MTKPIRVIVVEDNELLLDELLFQLNAQGFWVRGVGDGPSLEIALADSPADILVLDINLPGEDGFSLARRLHDPAKFGIIMLTARDAIDDKLHALEGGADLYLVKPVDRRELAASIRAVYRRLPFAEPSNEADWRLLRECRLLVAPDRRELALTPTELKVLEWLLVDQGSMRSRQELLLLLGIDGLVGADGRANTRMSRLRQKLSDFDQSLQLLSWRNQGYSYVGPPLRVE